MRVSGENRRSSSQGGSAIEPVNTVTAGDAGFGEWAEWVLVAGCPGRRSTPTSWPAANACRRTAEPMKPVEPVIKIRDMKGLSLGRIFPDDNLDVVTVSIHGKGQ
jgi:hypothetical protein